MYVEKHLKYIVACQRDGVSNTMAGMADTVSGMSLSTIRPGKISVTATTNVTAIPPGLDRNNI